jgi:hypothetical protein
LAPAESECCCSAENALDADPFVLLLTIDEERGTPEGEKTEEEEEEEEKDEGAPWKRRLRFFDIPTSTDGSLMIALY